MSSSPQGPDRGKNFIHAWWPVLVTLAAVGVSAVRADSRINDTRERVDYVYAQGSPAVVERLARIEANQVNVSKQLDRIERKLDGTEATR